ncbi:MAG: hypothetical protein ACRCZF_03655 [Gemmataceae bacterium]
MSRAYRITVRESLTREIRGSDEIATQLELLGVLPPEAMAELLKGELRGRGYDETPNGTFTRTDGAVTVTVDPCDGTVVVRAEQEKEVTVEKTGEAGYFDDVGPSEKNVRERVAENLRKQLAEELSAEQKQLQEKATAVLEGHLADLQPELAQIVNKVTREALKQKAAQLGTIQSIHEDDKTGDLTMTIEV